jgi:hypothetical protein
VKTFDKFRKSVLDKNDRRFELIQQRDDEPSSVKIKDEPIDDIDVFEIEDNDDDELDVKQEPFDEMDLMTEIVPERPKVPPIKKFAPKIKVDSTTIKRITIQKKPPEKVAPRITGVKCKYCPNSFIDLTFLNNHIEQKHHFACTTCAAVFPFKITLVKHHMSAHGHNVAMLGGNSPLYKFGCYMCGLKFMSQESLDMHKKHKHNVLNQESTVQKVEELLQIVKEATGAVVCI